VYDYINVILVAMRLALTKSKSMHYLMKTFTHFKQQLDISKALKAEKAISMHDINSLESS
jgi:homoserine acetyltransferase